MLTIISSVLKGYHLFVPFSLGLLNFSRAMMKFYSLLDPLSLVPDTPQLTAQ